MRRLGELLQSGELDGLSDSEVEARINAACDEDMREAASQLVNTVMGDHSEQDREFLTEFLCDIGDPKRPGAAERRALLGNQ